MSFFSYEKQRSAVMREGLFFMIIVFSSLDDLHSSMMFQTGGRVLSFQYFLLHTYGYISCSDKKSLPRPLSLTLAAVTVNIVPYTSLPLPLSRHFHHPCSTTPPVPHPTPPPHHHSIHTHLSILSITPSILHHPPLPSRGDIAASIV